MIEKSVYNQYIVADKPLSEILPDIRLGNIDKRVNPYRPPMKTSGYDPNATPQRDYSKKPEEPEEAPPPTPEGALTRRMNQPPGSK